MMWFVVLVLFGLMFIVEEKVKHRVWQPVLFLIISLAVAHVFVYWERIVEAVV